MNTGYGNDLACIHDAGYGQVAQAAATLLLRHLRQSGRTGGLVVDLGCGSGQLSEAVAAAGFDVVGIDQSPAMVALARQRVPTGTFHTGSFLTAPLPPCIALAAVSEVFNYLFDPRNNEQRLRRLFRRVHAALEPGGVFLFDVLGPGRLRGRGPQRQYREGDGWAGLVETAEDRDRCLLTRRITSFRRVGELYRRDEEVHRVRLFDGAALAEQLRSVGFRVRRLAGYGAVRFGRGQLGFLARKPAP